MPGYVKKALKKFNNKPPKRPEHAPHNWTAPIYGQRTQQRSTQESTAPLLPPSEKQLVQEITGTFLYYGLVIDYGVSEACWPPILFRAKMMIESMLKP